MIPAGAEGSVRQRWCRQVDDTTSAQRRHYVTFEISPLQDRGPTWLHQCAMATTIPPLRACGLGIVGAGLVQSDLLRFRLRHGPENEDWTVLRCRGDDVSRSACPPQILRRALKRRCFSSLRSSLRFRYSFLLEPEQQGAPDLFRLGDAVSGLDLFQQSRVSRVEPK